jgi:hypothetical protein
MSEEQRAEQLALEIDRLMAGEAPASTDPILDVASLLAKTPVTPGPAAVARFEQQMQNWFPQAGPSGLQAPRMPRPLGIPAPVILAAIVGIASVVIILALLLSSRGNTGNNNGGPTPGALPSKNSIMATQVATSVATMAATTGAMPTFARIIINGRIDNLRDATIVVFGQTIQITGTIKLCAGDTVKIEAVVGEDGTLKADATSITVSSSACPTKIPLAPPAPSSGGSGGNNGGSHGEHGDRGD